jgi:DNA-binding NarL/FixJ family response regulator
MTGNPIHVAIADDQALVRAGFRMIIDEEPDMTVVAEAATGAEAIAVVSASRPDVVLMDIRMPHVDGIEATRRLCGRTDTGPKIIILTTFDLDEYVYEGLRAGASGFLLKDTLAHDLLAAIRDVHAGGSVTAPTVTRRLVKHYTATARRRRPDPEATRLSVLTPRERDVLTLIARGRSNTEIAADLVLAEGTVKTHVTRILSKLHLRDRVQAVILGYQTGIACDPDGLGGDAGVDGGGQGEQADEGGQRLGDAARPD